MSLNVCLVGCMFSLLNTKNVFTSCKLLSVSYIRSIVVSTLYIELPPLLPPQPPLLAKAISPVPSWRRVIMQNFACCPLWQWYWERVTISPPLSLSPTRYTSTILLTPWVARLSNRSLAVPPSKTTLSRRRRCLQPDLCIMHPLFLSLSQNQWLVLLLLFFTWYFMQILSNWQRFPP